MSTTALQASTPEATLAIVQDDFKGRLSEIMGNCNTIEVCEGIKGLIEGVLSRSSPTTHASVAQCFTLALSGEHWGKALDDAGIMWAMLEGLRARNQEFSALFDVVRGMAEGACKLRRVKMADHRAFTGIKRPVFQGGVHVGDTIETSDRLAELLITGDDRARYAPSTSQTAQAGVSGPIAIQINIVQAPTSAPVQVPAVTVESVIPRKG